MRGSIPAFHTKELALAGDVEGYESREGGQLYLLDLGRVMPPEDPRQVFKCSSHLFFKLKIKTLILPVNTGSSLLQHWNNI